MAIERLPLNPVFCHNCGHRNPPGVNFCSSCGAALAPNSDTTISFIPEESTGEVGEEELGVEVGEIAEGTGVLVVKRGPNSGSKFVLDAPAHARRSPSRQRDLSRRHHRFSSPRRVRRERTTATRVRDVGSLNGTYVNRERIDEVALKSGDEVQIGKFKLVFLSAQTS